MTSPFVRVPPGTPAARVRVDARPRSLSVSLLPPVPPSESSSSPHPETLDPRALRGSRSPPVRRLGDDLDAGGGHGAHRPREARGGGIQDPAWRSLFEGERRRPSRRRFKELCDADERSARARRPPDPETRDAVEETREMRYMMGCGEWRPDEDGVDGFRLVVTRGEAGRRALSEGSLYWFPKNTGVCLEYARPLGSGRPCRSAPPLPLSRASPRVEGDRSRHGDNETHTGHGSHGGRGTSPRRRPPSSRPRGVGVRALALSHAPGHAHAGERAADARGVGSSAAVPFDAAGDAFQRIVPRPHRRVDRALSFVAALAPPPPSPPPPRRPPRLSRRAPEAPPPRASAPRARARRRARRWTTRVARGARTRGTRAGRRTRGTRAGRRRGARRVRPPRAGGHGFGAGHAAGPRGAAPTISRTPSASSGCAP